MHGKEKRFPEKDQEKTVVPLKGLEGDIQGFAR